VLIVTIRASIVPWTDDGTPMSVVVVGALLTVIGTVEDVLAV